MGLLLWIAPLIAVLIFSFFKEKHLLHITGIVALIVMMFSGIMLTKSVIDSGNRGYAELGGLFYLDSISILILDIVLAIGFLAAVYSIGYLDEELKHGKIDIGRIRFYYVLMFAFLFTMIFALTVKNMGIMWIAIEATTLASAFLVGFNNDKKAIEAAWKYVIICSVGIAVALLGIVFLHMSSVGVINGSNLLDWTELYGKATELKSSVLRFAFIFILIGFGTKAGLAPMHTWLPDAHSQAPSPISALLSGVLLNSALYTIIRTVSIVNKNLGSSLFTGRLLIGAGLLSIITAAVFILTQKDYKRLLAYSSIEHMGIITFGIGMFTPLSVFAALFHMINHSLTKSMLFLSSGSILQKYGTRDIHKVRNLLKILPVSGTVFLLGLFAIAGTPPFSVFSSELNVLVSVFNGKNYFLGGIVIILLAFVFAGIAVTLFRMFFGKHVQEGLEPGEVNKPGTVVMILLLALITAGGLYMPEVLKNLITQAQRIITGGNL